MNGGYVGARAILVMFAAMALGFYILVTGGQWRYRSRRLALPLLSSWMPFCGGTLMFATDPRTHQPPQTMDIVAGAFLVSLWLCLTTSSIRKARAAMRRQPSEADLCVAEISAKERSDGAIARQARRISLSEAWANAKAGRKIGRTEQEVAEFTKARLRAQIAIEEAGRADDRLEDQFERLTRSEISLDEYADAIGREKSYLKRLRLELLGDPEIQEDISHSAPTTQIDEDDQAIAQREQWVVDQRMTPAGIPAQNQQVSVSIWAR